jgi:hypothetical protein
MGNETAAPVVKTCTCCGRGFTREDWERLSSRGVQRDSDRTPVLELRDCPCGSTLARPLRYEPGRSGSLWAVAALVLFVVACGPVKERIAADVELTRCSGEYRVNKGEPWSIRTAAFTYPDGSVLATCEVDPPAAWTKEYPWVETSGATSLWPADSDGARRHLCVVFLAGAYFRTANGYAFAEYTGQRDNGVTKLSCVPADS